MTDKWISVKDKLPDSKQEVIVTVDNGKERYSMSAVWDDGRFSFFGRASGEVHWMLFPMLSTVIAWQPLPSPPKP